ncbi:hypothetical protein BVRB_7g158020 [Beta vulgaris subsp. vulgaris]|nr:hypothetical protein BVRB_7g158020 [Beta vulgaris subsp. vulgaris]
MSNSEGQELAKKPSPVNDVESTERETPAPELTAAEAEVVGIGSVLRRSRRESFVRKVSVGLRALGFVFSVLSFIIMLSNNHGNGRKYGEYEEYRYLLAIAMFSTLYTGLQSFRHINQLCTGK